MNGDHTASVFIYSVGAIVLLLLSASVVVSLFDHSYQTPTPLWGLAGIVVGAVFSDVFLKRARQRVKAEIAAEARRDDES